MSDSGKESAMKTIKWMDSIEAKKMFCPFSMGNSSGVRLCSAGNCLAWRKMPIGNDKFSAPEVREANARMGNCKLIDKE